MLVWFSSGSLRDATVRVLLERLDEAASYSFAPPSELRATKRW
jgi:hypothetical protein